MQVNNKTIPMLLGLGVLAAILVLASSGGPDSSADAEIPMSLEGASMLEIPEARVALGDVSMADGIAEHVFTIRNTGDGALRIGALETSCMCTTARLEVDGEMGPIFGMPGHGRSSRSWAMNIPPGTEGQLHVYYDPNAHGPAGVGPFMREISFTTNDSSAPRASVRISGTTVR